MVLFLLYLVVVFCALSGRAGARRGPPGLAAALRTRARDRCVSALFLSEQYFAPFWLIGALAAAPVAGGRA